MQAEIVLYTTFVFGILFCLHLIEQPLPLFYKVCHPIQVCPWRVAYAIGTYLGLTTFKLKPILKAALPFKFHVHMMVALFYVKNFHHSIPFCSKVKGTRSLAFKIDESLNISNKP